MRRLIGTLSIALGLLFFTKAQAHNLVEISIPSYGTHSSLMHATTMGKKKKKRMQKVDLLRRQNMRLLQEIDELEQVLNDCSNVKKGRTYRDRGAYRFTEKEKELFGKRKLSREYQRLKVENDFLRQQRDWLLDDLKKCKKRRFIVIETANQDDCSENDRSFIITFKGKDKKKRKGLFSKKKKKNKRKKKCKCEKPCD